MPSIRLERVAFAHADHVPVLSSDLRVARGWTAVVGENGAGKTTLLRLVAGELAPDEGRLRVDRTNHLEPPAIERLEDALGAYPGGAPPRHP